MATEMMQVASTAATRVGGTGMMGRLAAETRRPVVGAAAALPMEEGMGKTKAEPRIFWVRLRGGGEPAGLRVDAESGERIGILMGGDEPFAVR